MINVDLHPSWLFFSGVVLALFPLIIPVISGWTKISIILGFVRSGMGFQHTGAALVDGSLGLLIALIVAAPISSNMLRDLEQVLKVVDFTKGPSLQHLELFKAILNPWESFLKKNSGSVELRIANNITQPERHISQRQTKVNLNPQTNNGDFLRPIPVSGAAWGNTYEARPTFDQYLNDYLEFIYVSQSAIKNGSTVLSPVISSSSNRAWKIGEQKHREQLSSIWVPAEMAKTSLLSVILAFFLTEVREGLILGLKILIPFLMVDFVVANLLAGMGMFLLSPQVITLPLKVLLFVGAGGYTLLTQGAVLGYVY